jgi:very-short-patch-repair endonuclease
MPGRLIPVARKLRSAATSAERKLWNRVRREQIAGFKFRRQVVLGPFIVDFACLEARLILEVDGATHSTEAEAARDAARAARLRAMGFVMLRFTNDDVFREIDGVVETIRLKLEGLRPRAEA